MPRRAAPVGQTPPLATVPSGLEIDGTRMPERVLITGGAGFVGSHLADALLARGHRVIAFDNLEPQVHGTTARPAYLSPEVELVRGDVRDTEVLAPLLRSVDVVFHFAALVGVAQSMYDIRRYSEVNALGAATLLQTLVDCRGTVRKLIVASSNTVYGEGAYQCPAHGRVFPGLRPEPQLAARRWEPRCPRCGDELTPLPTDEDKPRQPASVYAITKRDQEELFLNVGQAYGIPSVVLRFFNIYGARQALSNPYTGVANIFCARLLSGQAPLIFEDGHQTRDLVHVSDIVQGCLLAMERPEADYQVLNLGSGQAVRIGRIAELLAERLGWRGPLTTTNTFRVGDVRHCYADLSRSRALLGYRPRVSFEQGVDELIAWVSSQPRHEDRSAQAAAELAARGLAR